MKKIFLIISMLMVGSAFAGNHKKLNCKQDSTIVNKIVSKYNSSSWYSKYDRKCIVYGKVRCMPMYSYDEKSFLSGVTEYYDGKKCDTALEKIEKYLLYSTQECWKRDDTSFSKAKIAYMKELSTQQAGELYRLKNQSPYKKTLSKWGYQYEAQDHINYGNYKKAQQSITKKYEEKQKAYRSNSTFKAKRETIATNLCCEGSACKPY